jgi:hypothetical protein
LVEQDVSMAGSKKQAQALAIKLSRERRAGKQVPRHQKVDIPRKPGRGHAEISRSGESVQSAGSRASAARRSDHDL